MDELHQALQRTLVMRCQCGDRVALEELFRRFDGPLCYYLRRMLARREVGDVQQEVWTAVLRRIGELRAPDAFVVWFYRIARSKAADHAAEGRGWTARGAPEALDLATYEAEPDTDLAGVDPARVHAALGMISPDHREVLVLRFLEDLSYQQIGEVTGEPLGTVRSRIHYAKLALKAAIERNLTSDPEQTP